MQSITVRRAGSTVQFINNDTHLGLQMQSWEHADEFAQALRRVARFGGRQQPTSSVRIREEENHDVLIEHSGQVFALVPAAAALELSNAVISQARVIEEEAKAADIIFDQALLQRTGALPGIGLSNNPAIQEEAEKEAAWNATLRRYIRHSVRQTNRIGTPKVVR